jgi:phage baseplate assembly protein W
MTQLQTRKINFKHVGIKRDNRRFDINIEPPSIPVGIKTPLEKGSGKSGLFTMHFQPAEQIHDNLRNLIVTNHGERLGRFSFGANLKSLTFDLSSMGDFEDRAAENIKDAVQKYMPFVELEDMLVNVTDHADNLVLPNGLAEIVITVTYNIPKLKVIGRKLQAVIYAGG